MPQINSAKEFDPEVKRNNIDNDFETAFGNGQKGNDDPISEPLRIIDIASIHRFEGHVRGIHKGYQIENQLFATNQRNGSRQQQGASYKENDFGIPRLFFNVAKFFCRRREEARERG